MEHLVWIDCEMTGLDPRADLLLEVACLVTDSDLNVLGEGVDIVIATPLNQLERMGDSFVPSLREYTTRTRSAPRWPCSVMV